MAKVKPATYEDLLRLPENMVGEIIDGELVATPRPAARHSLAASMLGGDLTVSFGRNPKGGGGPGGWWILDEPELHFGKDVLVPDLAGWRRERMPKVPDTTAIELAPDWVCEVVSPSTARIDRTRKMRVFKRVKVGHLWLLDPIARTLEVFRLESKGWLRVSDHDGNEPVRAEPFEAVQLDPSQWWGEAT
jgi:Uma2 family endonuclease